MNIINKIKNLFVNVTYREPEIVLAKNVKKGIYGRGTLRSDGMILWSYYQTKSGVKYKWLNAHEYHNAVIQNRKNVAECIKKKAKA